MRKDRLDGVGLGALGAVTLLLAFNQIIVKEVNSGIQPVFFAGLRSALAVGFVWGWLQYRGLWARVRLADGPVLNLNLPAPGDVAKARPTVTPTVGDADIAAPAAVVLPSRQADLGA